MMRARLILGFAMLVCVLSNATFMQGQGTSQSANVVRIGGNIMMAKLVSQVMPVYPQIATQAHIEGTVVLHAIVGTDGAVRDLQYVSGPPLLMKASMEAVRKWRYEPILLNGEPVTVDTTVSVVFTLGNAPPPSSSESAPSQQLQALARKMTFDWAKSHPLTATALGLSDEDGQLDTPSEAANAHDLEMIRGWESELASIHLDGASLVDVDDAKLLRAQLTGLEREYTVYKVYEKDPSAPCLSILGAIYTQFLHLPIAGTSGATQADVGAAWDKIIQRLSGAPAYIDAGNALVTHPGHLYGVSGAEQLDGAPSLLGGPLTDAAKAQLPADRVAEFEKARDTTLAVMARTKKYIDEHAASWPENYAIGAAAYDALLRDEQLLPFNANDIERMGREELAHGWTVQAWVQDMAAQRGTPIGPESGGGLAPGGAPLIAYYRERIAQLAKFVTEHHVVDIPDWLGEIQVVETPKFMQPVSPGAAMDSPLLFSKASTGFYFITPPTSLEEAAKSLDANQDFDRDRILSTGAHEAMPGHFLQLSIARRHPDFVRKIQESGEFAEGWAYYGEEMFMQLGLFGDDLDARYYVAQWERVRGARAVVDPKLASGEWTVDQAVQFFAHETGFSQEQAKAAVDGIALGPGYVIAYTAGRAEIETLLAEYITKAGANASLRDFHDRVLCYGTTPFSIVGPELLADLSKSLADVRAGANY
jgi:TonB family protein